MVILSKNKTNNYTVEATKIEITHRLTHGYGRLYNNIFKTYNVNSNSYHQIKQAIEDIHLIHRLHILLEMIHSLITLKVI